MMFLVVSCILYAAKLQLIVEVTMQRVGAISKNDVANMKRNENQMIIFYMREAAKSVGEQPMNFTKLR